jgi:hypothetical protein
VTATDYSVAGDGQVYPSHTATATEVLPHVAVTLKPASIPANGLTQTVATVKLTVGSSPVAAGDQVAVSSGDPGETVGDVRYQGKGVYTVVITSSESPGRVRITATDESANGPDAGSAVLVQSKPRTPPR